MERVGRLKRNGLLSLLNLLQNAGLRIVGVKEDALDYVYVFAALKLEFLTSPQLEPALDSHINLVDVAPYRRPCITVLKRNKFGLRIAHDSPVRFSFGFRPVAS